MSETSREFIKKHCPHLLNCEKPGDVMEGLDDFINENGFEPPKYYDYNDLGREAQRALDDVYLSN